MVLTSLVHPYTKCCHFQWFAPYISANVLGAATSQSHLGLKTSRLGLGSKGLVHIPDIIFTHILFNVIIFV